jgi:CelD/BcsL family acetyltransferase involved in cellulose biosynthesis
MQSDNPFLGPGFIEEYMERARSSGWTPLVLLISVDQTLSGLVPLMTRKKFGIRQAKSLPFIFFSDLLSLEAHRELVTSETLDFLFKSLNCQLATFVLPAESPHLRLLTSKCHEMRIHVTQSILGGALGRAVLPLGSSWQQYARSRGKKFVQDIRRTERSLNAIGEWSIVRLGEHEQREAFDWITRIEGKSWKASQRVKRGQGVDGNLLMVWRGLRRSGIDWYVYFLQLNSLMISYVLVVEFGGIVFPVFTSFDQQYATLGPGVYLMNMLIRDSFEKGRATKVDFLSDVPFTRTWTSICLKRVMLMMTARGSLAHIIAILYPCGLARVFESCTTVLEKLLPGHFASKLLDALSIR